MKTVFPALVSSDLIEFIQLLAGDEDVELHLLMLLILAWGLINMCIYIYIHISQAGDKL